MVQVCLFTGNLDANINENSENTFQAKFGKKIRHFGFFWYFRCVMVVVAVFI